MSSGSKTTSRELEAEAAAKAAANGELPSLKEYTLQKHEGLFRLTVHPFFARNTQFGKGDIAEMYADLSRGMIVYDFQPRDQEVTDERD